MEIRVPKTICRLCNKSYEPRGMTRHIKACLKKSLEKEQSEKKQSFCYIHIREEGEAFHLHLKVSANATLKTLDKFLRDIWLECCGHLSAFRYEERGDEISMSRKIGTVFKPGMEVVHEYDFGTTTLLRVRALDFYEGTMKKKNPVEIMARNAPPEILCKNCGKRNVTCVCAECMWKEEGYMCDECSRKHSCGEEMLLPFINSPRSGMCAYEGPSVEPGD